MVIAAPDCLAPEAARIVGAGAFRIFGSVVLPLAHPALITLTILSFQGSWNEQPQFIVASQDPELATLTKGAASMNSGQLGSGNQYPLTMAAAVPARGSGSTCLPCWHDDEQG